MPLGRIRSLDQIFLPLSVQEIFSPISECLEVMDSNVFQVLHTARMKFAKVKTKIAYHQVKPNDGIVPVITDHTGVWKKQPLPMLPYLTKVDIHPEKYIPLWSLNFACTHRSADLVLIWTVRKDKPPLTISNILDVPVYRSYNLSVNELTTCCNVTCRTRRPFSASTDSQHEKNSSTNSCPTLSSISLQNSTTDQVISRSIIHELNLVGATLTNI